MENVASMNKKDGDIITGELTNVFTDTQLIKTNSADISLANRRRLYWTNIPNVGIPKPKKIRYQDIVVNGYVNKEKANVLLGSNCTLNNGIFRYYKMGIVTSFLKMKDLPINLNLANYCNILR